MKTFFENLLIVGGIYFIISLFIPATGNIFATILNTGLFFLFITMSIVLCIKKSFKFVENLQNKTPKIYNYLKALGATQLFGFCFIGIHGVIGGYNAAQAQYNGTEYQSNISEYLAYTVPAYIAIFILSLLWATYACFIKPRLKK